MKAIKEFIKTYTRKQIINHYASKIETPVHQMGLAECGLLADQIDFNQFNSVVVQAVDKLTA